MWRTGVSRRYPGGGGGTEVGGLFLEPIAGGGGGTDIFAGSVPLGGGGGQDQEIDSTGALGGAAATGGTESDGSTFSPGGPNAAISASA